MFVEQLGGVHASYAGHPSEDPNGVLGHRHSQHLAAGGGPRLGHRRHGGGLACAGRAHQGLEAGARAEHRPGRRCLIGSQLVGARSPALPTRRAPWGRCDRRRRPGRPARRPARRRWCSGPPRAGCTPIPRHRAGASCRAPQTVGEGPMPLPPSDHLSTPRRPGLARDPTVRRCSRRRGPGSAG